MKDLVIIGGGPAGSASCVYSARKQLKTTLITQEWGGQSNVSSDIQNWIGTKNVSGSDFAKMLEEHAKSYKGDFLNFIENDLVVTVSKTDNGFIVETKNGEKIETKTVLVTTGSTRRKLSIPGAEKFDNKGVMYCASCDGPVFSGMDVAVIGGGNAALESVAELFAYAKSVTLFHRRNEYRADPITIEKVLGLPNVTALTPVDLLELKGEKMLEAVVYKNTETDEVSELKIAGLFVEIGLIPTTEYLGNLVELTEDKRIVIDPWKQTTSVKGIWAAGDCTNVLYHQNNIAAGDAVTAIEDIYRTLHAR